MRTVITSKSGKKRYFIGDEEVSESRYYANQPKPKRKSQSLIGWKPLVSDALAVHPDQIPEVVDRNRKHGVYCHYNADGSPILTSRQERKKLMVIHGHFDRDAGYGDKAKG